MLLHRKKLYMKYKHIQHVSYFEDLIMHKTFKNNKEIANSMHKIMSNIIIDSDSELNSYDCEKRFSYIEQKIVDKMDFFLNYTLLYIGYRDFILNMNASVGKFIKVEEKDINYCILSNSRFMKLILINDKDAQGFSDMDFRMLDLSSKNKLQLPPIYAIAFNKLYQDPAPYSTALKFYRDIMADMLRSLVEETFKYISREDNIDMGTLWHNIFILFFRNMFNSNINVVIKVADDDPKSCLITIDSNLIVVKSLKSIVNYVKVLMAQSVNVKSSIPVVKPTHSCEIKGHVLVNHVLRPWEIVINLKTLMYIFSSSSTFIKFMSHLMVNFFFDTFRLLKHVIVHKGNTGFYFQSGNIR